MKHIQIQSQSLNFNMFEGQHLTFLKIVVFMVFYIYICQNWVYNTVVSRQLAPIWGYNLSLIRELCECNSTSWLLDIPGFTR